jgi:hypothetical protein
MEARALLQWFHQISDQLTSLWVWLTTGRMLAVVLGVGFAFLALALFVLSRTRWGRAKPLTKFVVVSVVLHIWLLMYAVGNRRILPQGDPRGLEQTVSVSFEISDAESLEGTEGAPFEAKIQTPNQQLATAEPWQTPPPWEELPKPAELKNFDLRSAFDPPELLPAFDPQPMPPLPPELDETEQQLADNDAPDAATDVQQPENSSTGAAAADVAAEAVSREIAEVLPPPPPVLQPVASESSPVLPPERQLPDTPLPEDYRLRQAPNRLQLSSAFGADADTEAAVQAGLQWLARAQSADGSWNAAAYGAGTETYTLNEYRHGTGSRADTAMAGLALLAFLSAGHTHLEGEFRENVQRGLLYLIDSQMPSGDMSGPKQAGSDPSVLNSRMYCHSIATLAVAEAYAMTGDPALRNTVLKAAQYSVHAQDPRSGGWRYLPGDKGDLSQFGWQAMALSSVQRSGIRLPAEVVLRMHRFLDSCAAGRERGLATYKPREGRPSNTMTAEALACRLLLNYPLSASALREAKAMIMATRPGKSEDNVYFWYYATLALFQLQDEDWRVWNQALKERLLNTQLPSHAQQPGSWDPDRLWGGYGGRVYSTAMSCLCLEVYYRYLPMYRRSNLAQDAIGPALHR